jgi:hypothetical protein
MQRFILTVGVLAPVLALGSLHAVQPEKAKPAPEADKGGHRHPRPDFR